MWFFIRIIFPCKIQLYTFKQFLLTYLYSYGIVIYVYYATKNYHTFEVFSLQYVSYLVSLSQTRICSNVFERTRPKEMWQTNLRNLDMQRGGWSAKYIKKGIINIVCFRNIIRKFAFFMLPKIGGKHLFSNQF